MNSKSMNKEIYIVYNRNTLYILFTHICILSMEFGVDMGCRSETNLVELHSRQIYILAYLNYIFVTPERNKYFN